MRIRAFSTGRVRLKRGDRGLRRYVANDWRADTLPVNVFLIEHPGGLCLVDAGQSAAAAEPGYFPAWYPFFRLSRFELSPRDEAAHRIVAAGFDIRRIRWIVLTHLHTDHVGGLGGFRGPEVLVSRGEWDLAQGMGGVLRGYLKKEWPSGVEPHLVRVDGPPVGPFGASYDIAADGRLLMVPLPGHTGGHSAVLVRDGSASYLCAGDAAHDIGELAVNAPALSEWCKRERVTVLLTHDDRAPRVLPGPD